LCSQNLIPQLTDTMASSALTLRSTRPLSARSSSTSHVLDFTSLLNILSPAWPVMYPRQSRGPSVAGPSKGPFRDGLCYQRPGNNEKHPRSVHALNPLAHISGTPTAGSSSAKVKPVPPSIRHPNIFLLANIPGAVKHLLSPPQSGGTTPLG